MSQILLPSEILETTNRIYRTKEEIYYRNGVPIEKGAILSKKRVKKNLEIYQKWVEHFIKYPDEYLKLITPINSKFQLKFFQIIFIRACVRYGRVATIAPRAAGKSFICIIALILTCIFRPGAHVKRKALSYREV